MYDLKGSSKKKKIVQPWKLDCFNSLDENFEGMKMNFTEVLSVCLND